MLINFFFFKTSSSLIGKKQDKSATNQWRIIFVLQYIIKGVLSESGNCIDRCEKLTFIKYKSDPKSWSDERTPSAITNTIHELAVLVSSPINW